jgi:hypothetical protein
MCQQLLQLEACKVKIGVATGGHALTSFICRSLKNSTPFVPNYLNVLIGTQILRNL